MKFHHFLAIMKIKLDVIESTNMIFRDSELEKIIENVEHYEVLLVKLNANTYDLM